MNVELIRKAIEHLKRDEVVLGRCFIYNTDTGLCCAVGEMAKVISCDPSRIDEGDVYEVVRSYYGLDEVEITTINDNLSYAYSPEKRKTAVIAYLESLIAEEAKA